MDSDIEDIDVALQRLTQVITEHKDCAETKKSLKVDALASLDACKRLTQKLRIAIATDENHNIQQEMNHYLEKVKEHHAKTIRQHRKESVKRILEILGITH